MRRVDLKIVDRKFNGSDSIRRGWTHDIEGRRIYTSDGVYRVVVTVTDDASASGSDSFQVVIQAPDFRALALVFEGAQLRVDFQSDATSYYILYRGIQVDYINQAVGMALGVGPSDSIVAPRGQRPIRILPIEKSGHRKPSRHRRRWY